MEIGETSFGVQGSSEYQVFLSFRGPDTRQGFSNTLYHCLTDAGICVFKDDEDQPLGEKIEKILDAINGSVICIPIFSRGYASSKWCLRELARMVELDKKIVPIFYDVTPQDVQLQTDLYVDALNEHAHKFKIGKDAELAAGAIKESGSEIQQWEDALRKVGTITGWELQDTGHGKFCNSITKEVLIRLNVKRKIVSDHLVGMDDQVRAVIEILDTKAHDVRYVGIHGMGGIGKTTLTKVVFNELSCQFDQCSFLSDIRESWNQDGIKCLQRQLLNDLGSNAPRDISDQDDGIRAIKAIMRNKKVLLVLDDVDQRDQIEKLAGNSSWFATGSRIIVTTRDIRVLATENRSVEVKAFGMAELDSTEALKLFSRHAFRNDVPPPDCFDLSEEAVSVTGHLPLFLEIIGSYLRSRCREEWQEKIKALGKIPPQNVQQKLMISYEALDCRAQQMFLDIGCFFTNRERTNAIYMWEALNFQPGIWLEELISASLVKIADGNKLWMHSLLRELAREIVQKENFMEPGRRSRLWMHEEAFGVLEGEEGTEEVQAMRMSNDERLTGHCFRSDAFKGLKNLRYLEWSRLAFVGDFSRLLTRLRWLSWHSCPAGFKASNLNLRNLVILELSWSNISENWEGWSQIKMGPHLKVLDLTGCKNLTRTPDFSKCSTLERLILANCEALTEMDSSIGKLKRLKHLDVRGCCSLQGLPEEVSSLEDLEEIFMGGKRNSFTLPENIGNLKSLIILELFNVRVTDGLPSSLCRLKKLKRLALIGCSGIEKLSDALGDLESLIKLDISYSTISELPDAIGNLKQLRVMVLSCSQVRKLPSMIGMLEKLEVLKAEGTLLTGELPREMAGLSRLKFLDLSNTGVQELFSVSKLSLLQTLNLEKCHQLFELPELPKSLVHIQVSSRSLQKLPDLSELHNLVDLKLYDANDDWALGLVLAKVGAYRLQESFCFNALDDADIGDTSNNIEWVRKMSKLVTLELSLQNSTNLPTDFRALTRLKVLELSCPNMPSPPQLPFTLSQLILGHLVVQQNLPDLSHLKNLTYLRFYNCLIIDGFFRIGIKELHSLNALMIDCCEIYDLCGCCLPESLRSISIYRCYSLQLFITLSSLENLKHLHLWECSNLRVLQGLGEVESLQWLEINGCHSLEKLEDLSKLKKLEVLEVEDCENLVDIEGKGGIKAMQDLIDERELAESPGELRVVGRRSQHSLQITTQSLDSLRGLSLNDIYKFWQ